MMHPENLRNVIKMYKDRCPKEVLDLIQQMADDIQKENDKPRFIIQYRDQLYNQGAGGDTKYPDQASKYDSPHEAAAVAECLTGAWRILKYPSLQEI